LVLMLEHAEYDAFVMKLAVWRQRHNEFIITTSHHFESSGGVEGVHRVSFQV
jgi:hypothetical protein